MLSHTIVSTLINVEETQDISYTTV